MVSNPLVSVIIIFLNAADFLEEAVESVFAQKYEDWELFLVDDGSTDKSSKIARQYSLKYPEKIIYLEHPDHQNKGKGASRNLGIKQAQGEFIAFLDADDVWLPNKLEEQVEIISSYPEAGMLYGNTLYWFSWTGNPEDVSKDFIPRLGVDIATPIKPPSLIPLYLRGKAAVPCTCSIIVRRKIAEEVNGFDETCQGISNFYEDQAFYAKICLVSPTVVVDACWDKYRQRSSSGSEGVERIIDNEFVARESFLNWLDNYITQLGKDEKEIRLAIRKELWLHKSSTWLSDSKNVRSSLRWIKKWILRLEEWIFPVSIQYWLWL